MRIRLALRAKRRMWMLGFGEKTPEAVLWAGAYGQLGPVLPNRRAMFMGVRARRNTSCILPFAGSVIAPDAT